MRGSGRFFIIPVVTRCSASCFNPLHCGAVVASEAKMDLPLDLPFCFNPLHCGAVVASSLETSSLIVRIVVSIPFIAGQWSLRFTSLKRRKKMFPFQSPSLRGSGRFIVRFRCEVRYYLTFQSPSLRGSGRFKTRSKTRSCGQISVFQSPSLRGSGRFTSSTRRPLRPPVLRFQSPSLRGSGRFVSKLGG